MRRENDERVKTHLRRKDLRLHSEGCIGKGIQHSVGRVSASIFILS